MSRKITHEIALQMHVRWERNPGVEPEALILGTDQYKKLQQECSDSFRYRADIGEYVLNLPEVVKFCDLKVYISAVPDLLLIAYKPEDVLKVNL